MHGFSDEQAASGLRQSQRVITIEKAIHSKKKKKKRNEKKYHVYTKAIHLLVFLCYVS